MRWVLFIAVVLLCLALVSPMPGTGGGSGQDGTEADDGSDLSSYGAAGTVAAAWARFENTQNRYNNPVGLHGNWQGVTGHTASGEAIFDNLNDAWAAVVQYIQQQATAHPDWSFNNFFGKVLGNLQGQDVNNDQGNSTVEASGVASFLGIDPATLVSSYLG